MMNETKAAKLEAAIRELTRPINGQYPRPWTISTKDPASSRVFVIGMNQAKTFPDNVFHSHDDYIDTLFRRGPETCRQIYDRLFPQPSPTRRNIDDLVLRLGRHGVTAVLDTNVICYSTPMSRDLKHAYNMDGAKIGREIFETLYKIIEPVVMIVYGVRAAKELSKVLNCPLPPPPTKLPSRPVEAVLVQTSAFVIPSLALPFYNQWSRGRDEHLDDLCRVVAARLE